MTFPIISAGFFNAPGVVYASFIFEVTVGSSDDFALPLLDDGTYNFTVNWGDGSSVDNITTWNQSETVHDYTSAGAGTYTIEINGVINGWSVDNYSDRNKLTKITHWGGLLVGSGSRAFTGCSNLTVTATDTLDTSSCTSFNQFFYGCSSLISVPNMDQWDVSSVTNMVRTFENCTVFNQDLNDWNVSAVTTMDRMFDDARAFDGDISDWDVSSVSDFSGTFTDARAFNQDISGWITTSATDFSAMFQRAYLFNQDIGGWDVSGVLNLSTMFHTATAFNQSLNDWDTSTVTNMSNMFQATTVFNSDISDWDVSSVTQMQAMFYQAAAFNQDISAWVTTSLTSMTSGGGIGMFHSATSFNQDISGWDISGVSDLRTTFNGATSFDQNLAAWDVISVTTMSGMFTSVTLSTTNYDALLIGWEAQLVQNSVVFGGGNSNYTSGGAAETARTNLINDHSWTITDGGSV